LIDTTSFNLFGFFYWKYYIQCVRIGAKFIENEGPFMVSREEKSLIESASKKYWEHFNKSLLSNPEEAKEGKDHKKSKDDKEPQEKTAQQEFLDILYQKNPPLYYADLKTREESIEIKFLQQIKTLVNRIKIIEYKEVIFENIQKLLERKLTAHEKQLIFPVQAILEMENPSDENKKFLYQTYMKETLIPTDMQVGFLLEDCIRNISLKEKSKWDDLTNKYFSPKNLQTLPTPVRMDLLEFGKKSLEGLIYAISQPTVHDGLVTFTLSTLQKKIEIEVCYPGMVSDLEEAYSPFTEGLQQILAQARLAIAKERGNYYFAHYLNADRLDSEKITENNHTHALSELMNPLRLDYQLPKNRDFFTTGDHSYSKITAEEREKFIQFFCAGFDVSLLESQKSTFIYAYADAANRNYSPLIIKMDDGYGIYGRKENHTYGSHKLQGLSQNEIRVLSALDYKKGLLKNSDISPALAAIIKKYDFYFTQPKLTDKTSTINFLVNRYKTILDSCKSQRDRDNFFIKFDQLGPLKEDPDLYFASDKKTDEEEPAYLPKNKLTTKDKCTDAEMRELLRHSILKRLTKSRALTSAVVTTIKDEPCDVILTPLKYSESDPKKFFTALSEKSQTQYSYVIQHPAIVPHFIIIDNNTTKVFGPHWFSTNPLEKKLITDVTYAIVRNPKNKRIKAYRLQPSSGSSMLNCTPIEIEDKLKEIVKIKNHDGIDVEQFIMPDGVFGQIVEMPEVMQVLQDLDTLSLKKIFYVDKKSETLFEIGEKDLFDKLVKTNSIELDMKKTRVQEKNKDRILAKINSETGHHHDEIVYLSDSCAFVEPRITENQFKKIVSLEEYIQKLSAINQSKLFKQLPAPTQETTPFFAACLPYVKEDALKILFGSSSHENLLKHVFSMHAGETEEARNERVSPLFLRCLETFNATELEFLFKETKSFPAPVPLEQKSPFSISSYLFRHIKHDSKTPVGNNMYSFLNRFFPPILIDLIIEYYNNSDPYALFQTLPVYPLEQHKLIFDYKPLTPIGQTELKEIRSMLTQVRFLYTESSAGVLDGDLILAGAIKAIDDLITDARKFRMHDVFRPYEITKYFQTKDNLNALQFLKYVFTTVRFYGRGAACKGDPTMRFIDTIRGIIQDHETEPDRVAFRKKAEQLNKMLQNWLDPKIYLFHITKDLAATLYRRVDQLGRGDEISKLSNEKKPEKFLKACEILSIQVGNIEFNDTDDYFVSLTADNAMILSDVHKCLLLEMVDQAKAQLLNSWSHILFKRIPKPSEDLMMQLREKILTTDLGDPIEKGKLIDHIKDVQQKKNKNLESILAEILQYLQPNKENTPCLEFKKH
jgi:hypothetical protein